MLTVAKFNKISTYYPVIFMEEYAIAVRSICSIAQPVHTNHLVLHTGKDFGEIWNRMKDE